MNRILTALVAVFLLLLPIAGPVYAAKVMPEPVARFFDENGDPLASGKVYTYEAGTSTPKATYTDNTEATTNANPVILDSDGEANIWLGEGSYKIVLKDSNDATQWTVDNVLGDSNAGFGQSVTNVSTNLSVTTAHENTFFNCSGSPTLSLLAASEADNFIFAIRNTSTGVCTIDPDGAETINGAATLTVDRSETAIVYSNGTAWFTIGHINILDEDTFTSNSDTAVPTQQSVKAYVDAEIDSNIAAIVGYKYLGRSVYTADDTFTKANWPDAAMVRVTVVGAGGGGGGADATNTSNEVGGAGGGGGGTCIEDILIASVGTTETVTVGEGGTVGAAATGGNGGTGETSSFGAHCSATGGGGGTGTGSGAAATENGGYLPGAGGVGSGGNINFSGSAGTTSGASAGAQSTGGTGGGSYLGGGGIGGRTAGGTNTAAAGAGGVYGGGGGGGADSTTSGAAGGIGGAGIVIVEVYGGLAP